MEELLDKLQSRIRLAVEKIGELKRSNGDLSRLNQSLAEDNELLNMELEEAKERAAAGEELKRQLEELEKLRRNAVERLDALIAELDEALELEPAPKTPTPVEPETTPESAVNEPAQTPAAQPEAPSERPDVDLPDENGGEESVAPEQTSTEERVEPLESGGEESTEPGVSDERPSGFLDETEYKPTAVKDEPTDEVPAPSRPADFPESPGNDEAPGEADVDSMRVDPTIRAAGESAEPADAEEIDLSDELVDGSTDETVSDNRESSPTEDDLFDLEDDASESDDGYNPLGVEGLLVDRSSENGERRETD